MVANTFAVWVALYGSYRGKEKPILKNCTTHAKLEILAKMPDTKLDVIDKTT